MSESASRDASGEAVEPVSLVDERHRCRRCNNFRDPSDLAYIDHVPLCHGATDRSPTCYEHTSWAYDGEAAMPAHLAHEFLNPPQTDSRDGAT